jgi:hypothetical protein
MLSAHAHRFMLPWHEHTGFFAGVAITEGYIWCYIELSGAMSFSSATSGILFSQST